MTFKKLSGSVRTRRQLPQCSAKVRYIETATPEHAQSMMALRRQHPHIGDLADPTCCSRGATIEIDGKPYCATHAGAIALERMIDRDAGHRFMGIDQHAGDRAEYAGSL